VVALDLVADSPRRDRLLGPLLANAGRGWKENDDGRGGSDRMSHRQFQAIPVPI
jgi:hypothetical protein